VNRRTWLKAAFATTLAGCGYTTRPLYPCTIQTVYVPMFDTKVFRRGLEFQLTEAVCKEIEQKTPYKILKRDSADTTLKGEIKSVRKRVIIQTPEDEPRELETAVAVEVEWRDNRTGALLCNGQTPGVPFVVRSDATYAPELGQTTSTAFKEMIDKLAVQIVAMMEEPW
jgi:Lipopolysaccharide-assembly